MPEHLQLMHTVWHPFLPIYDRDSRVLILGTMPSAASRQQSFYYGHPRNRFWPLMTALLNEMQPDGPEGKKAMLLRNHVALWDVLQQCDIRGSSDSSIRSVRVHPLSQLLSESKIVSIYANGQRAGHYYHQYCYPATRLPCHVLPSTSPANARYTLNDLIQAWQCLLKDICS